MNIVNNNVNFKAIKVAQTSNIVDSKISHIDLYKLTSNDSKFLDKLEKSVNFDKILGDSITDYDKKRWYKVFKYAVNSAKFSDSYSYIAVSGSKVCGIISFFDNISSLYLDALCSIPTKNNSSHKNVGNTLLYQMFKISEELNSKKIELDAITDGPVDVVSMYKRKGFKDIGMDGNYVKMQCNKYKIKEQLKELSSKISYNTVKKSVNENIDYLI